MWIYLCTYLVIHDSNPEYLLHKEEFNSSGHRVVHICSSHAAQCPLSIIYCTVLYSKWMLQQIPCMYVTRRSNTCTLELGWNKGFMKIATASLHFIHIMFYCQSFNSKFASHIEQLIRLWKLQEIGMSISCLSCGNCHLQFLKSGCVPDWHCTTCFRSYILIYQNTFIENISISLLFIRNIK